MATLLSLADHVARLRTLALVAEYRFQAGRIGFFAILSAHGRTEEEVAHYARVGQVAKSRADLARGALIGEGEIDGFQLEALDWARGHVRAIDGLGTKVARFHETLDETLRAAEVDRSAVIDYLLDVTDRAASLFGDAYGGLIAAMDKELEEANALRTAQSEEVTEEAKKAMVRIDAITRSVRLISINASVEAARVGDPGRGFSVIAGEIKTLAEAIAGASGDAGRSMDQLQSLARTQAT